MKFKILILLYLGFFSTISASFAQPLPTIPTPAASPAFSDLKGVMKAMGADFKELGLQINDSTQNESSLALAVDFASLVLEAQKFIPTSILKLPVEDQEAEIQKYHQSILSLSQGTAELISALKLDDETAILNAFNKIRAMKISGHSVFDPKP